MKTSNAKSTNHVFINILHLFFGTIVTKFIGAIATILYANYTDVKDYGVLSIALSFSAILTFLTDSGISHTAIREGTKKNSDIGKIMYSYVKVRVILFFLVSLFSTIFVCFIYRNDLQMQQAILLLVIPSLVGSLLQGVGGTFFQIIEKMNYVSYINIILGVGNSLALFLGILFQLSIGTICLVYGLSSVLAGIYGLAISVRAISFKKEFDRKILYQLLSFTTNSAIIILTPQLGPIILAKVLSVTDVAYYSAAFKIPAMLYQFPALIATAFYPKLFSLGNDKNSSEHRKTSSLELQLMTILGVGLSLPFILNPEYWILTLLGQKYLPSVNVLLILSFLVFIQAIKYPLADFLTTYGLQWQRTLIMLIGLAISIIGYIVLGQRFGIVGGALAPVFAEVIMIIGCALFITNGLSFLFKNIALILLSGILTSFFFIAFLTQMNYLFAIVIVEFIFIFLIILSNKNVQKIINLAITKLKMSLR